MPSEQEFRDQAFIQLRKISDENANVVTRAQLENFEVFNQKFKLIDIFKGIWSPAAFESTLSIVSGSDSYMDKINDAGLLQYSYQKGSINGVNRKLRNAMETGAPIILLNKIDVSLYVPVFPVYVVADDVESRYFEIAVDISLSELTKGDSLSAIEKLYANRVVKQRLHQPIFRGRVLSAYGNLCTVCTFKHPELLDAAHIIPDNHPLGTTVVQNGLSLCKIHHAAYDQNFLGISPDYTVEINTDLMVEVDGPMLKHGLQEMNKRKLTLPNNKQLWPFPDHLDMRYEQFKIA